MCCHDSSFSGLFWRFVVREVVDERATVAQFRFRVADPVRFEQPARGRLIRQARRPVSFAQAVHGGGAHPLAFRCRVEVADGAPHVRHGVAWVEFRVEDANRVRVDGRVPVVQTDHGQQLAGFFKRACHGSAFRVVAEVLHHAHVVREVRLFTAQPRWLRVGGGLVWFVFPGVRVQPRRRVLAVFQFARSSRFRFGGGDDRFRVGAFQRRLPRLPRRPLVLLAWIRLPERFELGRVGVGCGVARARARG